MNVNDLEIAKSVFNPKRLRILKLIDKSAKTVKEMAEELNEKPSRLYYHVHKLLELGLLHVAETKQVGHLTETYYQASPGIDSFDIDETFAKENTDFVANQLLAYINNALDTIKKDMSEGKSFEDCNSSASILNTELSQNDWMELNRQIRDFIHEKTKAFKEKPNGVKRNITYILMSYAED